MEVQVTPLIQNYWKLKPALLDKVDFRILRAVMGYGTNGLHTAPDAGLSDEVAQALEDRDAHCELVFAHYPAGSISFLF